MVLGAQGQRAVLACAPLFNARFWILLFLMPYLAWMLVNWVVHPVNETDVTRRRAGVTNTAPAVVLLHEECASGLTLQGVAYKGRIFDRFCKRNRASVISALHQQSPR
jgi:hypothetical protein